MWYDIHIVLYLLCVISSIHRKVETEIQLSLVGSAINSASVCPKQLDGGRGLRLFASAAVRSAAADGRERYGWHADPATVGLGGAQYWPTTAAVSTRPAARLHPLPRAETGQVTSAAHKATNMTVRSQFNGPPLVTGWFYIEKKRAILNWHTGTKYNRLWKQILYGTFFNG